MASGSGFDDSPTMQGLRKFSSLSLNNPATIASGGLKALMNCADMLFDAESIGDIKFAPGVPGALLEMVGLLVLRAAHLNEEKRRTYLRCWSKEGSEKVQQMIDTARVENRMITQDDLAVFMRCIPDDGD